MPWTRHCTNDMANLDALTSALKGLSPMEKVAAIAALMGDSTTPTPSAMPAPSAAATPTDGTTPSRAPGQQGQTMTINVPPVLILDRPISGPRSPRHEPWNHPDNQRWISWDGSWWRLYYCADGGRALPESTRIDASHKCYSALHCPTTCPLYEKSGRSGAVQMWRTLYWVHQVLASLFTFKRVRHSSHDGKHQCSRCHARDLVGGPAFRPRPRHLSGVGIQPRHLFQGPKPSTPSRSQTPP